MVQRGYIAVDLGAESGRAMLASLDGGRLSLQEVHRFANRIRQLPTGMHWDFQHIQNNVIQGISKAVKAAAGSGMQLASVGVDTWGVDYGLLDRHGKLLAPPYCYRDGRNPPAMQKALEKLGATRLYERTGLQLLPFNTLFQLLAHAAAEPGTIKAADKLLMIPDLLHHMLSGQAAVEASNASTTQMIDPRVGERGAWATDLLETLGLPTNLLSPIVPEGTVLGGLLGDVAKRTGAPKGLQVTLPASHDTASAVAAVPADPHTRWCYISSGTWSLMGAELDSPKIDEPSRMANFTNERGVDGSIRYLKNIPGLWMLQQVRQDLASHSRQLDYAQLAQLAKAAAPFATLLDPSHESFAQPGDMIAKIMAYAKATGQPVPEEPGPLARCCLESLALAYRRTLATLRGLLGGRFEVIHIVGGGARNELLNQLTADATATPVLAGPFEATAIGNALVQAIGQGEIKDLWELRQIVRQSFPPIRYQPHNVDAWDQAERRYANLGDDRP